MPWWCWLLLWVAVAVALVEVWARLTRPHREAEARERLERKFGGDWDDHGGWY